MTFQRVTKRVVHWWAQSIEQSLEQHFLSQCPDVQVSARYHPFFRSSRAKGNKSLQLSLVSRFQARPGGYVSTKSEVTLHELGIVSTGSKLGGKTAGEYTLRLLGKCSSFVQHRCIDEGLRTLNFCFDAAMVGEESATQMNSIALNPRLTYCYPFVCSVHGHCA